jgi:hypothetical protein
MEWGRLVTIARAKLQQHRGEPNRGHHNYRDRAHEYATTGIQNYQSQQATEKPRREDRPAALFGPRFAHSPSNPQDSFIVDTAPSSCAKDFIGSSI